MIKYLRLAGFKSFLKKSIEFSNLTVLTGLNSSGKSSIIQALLILEKASRNEPSILLDDHGTISALLNKSHNGDILLEVVDNEDAEFGVELYQIPKSEKSYSVKVNETFSFPHIIYVSANRLGPKPYVKIFNDPSQKNKLGHTGENLFQFIHTYSEAVLDQRLIHINSEGQTLDFNIRGWLSVISPNIKFNYKLDTNSDTSYSLFNEHRANNVGFGLSYALPVIASLLIGSLIKGSLVIIDNPEGHLHPKGQTEIAELISRCVLSGTQVIIETHSDHIFEGIRIAAKNHRGFADLVKMHWFELDEEFLTEITSPTLDENGRIDQWPKGFFDQYEHNISKLLE